MRSATPKSLVILATLSLLLAAVVTETVLYSRNTPAHHPEWVLAKLLVPGDLMGSAESFVTRNLLRRNRLNLHDWHGSHEILLNRIISLGSMTARFAVGADGYLIAIFNKNAAGFSGVRVSRNPLFPNLFFRASGTGKFLATVMLESTPIDGGWHDLTLRFDDGMLQVSVDDRPIGRIEESSLAEQVVGLKSGYRLALVDNVEVRAGDGTVVMDEDFRNDRAFWATLVPVFAVVFLIGALLYLTSSRRGADGKPMLFTLILVEAFLVIVFLLYFLFDYYLYSQNYYYETNPRWVAVPQEQLLFEAARRYVFTQLPFFDCENDALLSSRPDGLIRFLDVNPADYAKRTSLSVVRGPVGSQEIEQVEDNRQAIEAYLDRNDIDSSIRILLLGSSQTWGEGARVEKEKLAPTLQRILAARWSPNHDVAVVNAARQGTRSAVLLDRYRSHLFLFRPHIVVANLSNNDRHEGFAENLVEIAALSADRGATPLFVLEANSGEVGNWLGPRHQIMRDTAAAHGIPIADLSGHMTDPAVYDTGILWWDFVHLTTYGQRLAAEFIANFIVENFALRDEPAPSADPSGTDD